MAQSEDRESIREEITDVLKNLGIPLPTSPKPKLTSEEFRRIHSLAMQVINGDVDREEIARLSEDHAAELSNMIQYMVSLRDKASIRDLQERNPYYGVFTSKIVRDGKKQEG